MRGAVGRDQAGRYSDFESSLPGIAVRRTASLPLAYDPAIHLLRKAL
jgi:hypothetical protein